VLDELLLLVRAGQIELKEVYLPEEMPPEPEAEPEPELAIATGFEVVREQRVAQADGSVVSWVERLLVIRSQDYAESQIRHFEKRLAQAETEIEGLTPPPGRGQRQFTDPVALEQQIATILSRYRVVGCFEIELERQVSQRQVRGYNGQAGRIEEKVRYQVHLSRRAAAIEQARFRLGWRLYATNTPARKLSLDEAVLTYRGQYLAERAFARLKGPLLRLLPLYVHRDDHALGLIRLLTIGLRALSVIEFVTRRTLAQQEEALSGLYPGNPKRQTRRPSAELLLNAFEGITLSIRFNEADERVELYLTPFNAVQRRILTLLELPPGIYHCLTGFPVAWSLPRMAQQPASLSVG